MAVEIISGPSFAGKSEFAQQEIAAAEQEGGELGLVAVSFSEIFRAIVPGEQSQLRDEDLAASGASRFAGATYDAAVGLVLARELSGFLISQSPRRAVSLSDRFGGVGIWDVTAPPDALAVRVAAHVSALQGRIARAGDAAEAACRRQVLTYYNERPVLVGRAREVTQPRRGRFRKGAPVRQFDEALFVRGLTPAGRQARDQLIDAGDSAPTPAAVFRQVMKNLGRRDDR